jgi:hypothetical protein
MDTTYLHIGMILSTLGLSPHGFALGLYPKGLMPMEIFVHLYIPMILLISNQCGTLVVYPTGMMTNKTNLCTCLWQYKLGRKVGKILKEVERLQKAGSFHAGMVISNHQASTTWHIPGP